MKTFSDKTNDLDSLLNPKIFLKSKKKICLMDLKKIRQLMKC